MNPSQLSPGEIDQYLEGLPVVERFGALKNIVLDWYSTVGKLESEVRKHKKLRSEMGELKSRLTALKRAFFAISQREILPPNIDIANRQANVFEKDSGVYRERKEEEKRKQQERKEKAAE